MSKIMVYTELLKIIEQQEETIVKLVNENAQLENDLRIMCEEVMTE